MSCCTIPSHRTTPAPVIVIGLGVAAVSAASIFIRFAQAAGAASLMIAAMRLVIASALLAPLAWSRCRAEFRTLTPKELALALISGLCLGGHFAAWILSLALTNVISSVVLVSFSPLFVAIASAVFLKERISGRMWLGMVIAVAGGIAIGLASATGAANGPMTTGRNPLFGDGLALAGAMCLTPYLIIGRALRAKLSLLAYITLVYGSGAIALLVLVGVTHTPLTVSDPSAWAWIALLAAVPQLIGHTAFNWAVRRMPAVFATVPVLGEPIGSSILAIVVLGEIAKPLTLAGAALALAGIILLSRTAGDA